MMLITGTSLASTWRALTEALSGDGTALNPDLARSLSLSAEHSLASIPKSWVSEEEVENLTARFDAALCGTELSEVCAL